MNHIEKMCRHHFNEPILSHLEVGRLVGYAEDSDDCYLIIKKCNGELVWHTAVGGYTFLACLKYQDVTSDGYNDLRRLNTVLEINDCPAEQEFLLSINR